MWYNTNAIHLQTQMAFLLQQTRTIIVISYLHNHIPGIMYVYILFDYAQCRLLGNVIVLFPDDYGCLVGSPVWVFVDKLVYYLTIQPIYDVAYKLSSLT